MKHIDKLLSESTTSMDSQPARPALLALTRATTNLIYQDLVATQYTSKNTAALYGVKYLNPNKELSFVTGATYSGAIGKEARKTMKEMAVGVSLAKGELFKYQDVVFKSLVADPFTGTTETDEFDILSEAVAASTIRMVPEAADTEYFEGEEPDIAEASFEINKWQAEVKSRKFKTEFTVELAQDMEAAGFDAPTTIEDLLATQMAEEINKDILQSLVTVSNRFKVKGVSDKGVLDLSDASRSSVETGRELYRFICEMNANIQRQTSYSATYVVASSRVAALLAASGWLEKKDDQPYAAYGVLKNGLVLYCDNNNPVEYVVVGVKAEFGDSEMVGSLFYAPFAEGLSKSADPTDHIGTYKVINDASDLQPRIALMVRYALCVNPYTMGIDNETARVIDASDIDQFAAQSKMSVLLGVKLPKLV
ncbi:gp24 head vertex protein [Acinetobacter phage Acj9]|uniref:Capsid vertex protein n=1 Tax=Acinetobacter phage Acj9 TaxID=760939 RepID=E5EPX0_9CAUD|nr:gp24 head vertex protein [Acinetobacter phage Acj9]ADG60086.1 gp24 head vertex protein [Acinetobacter phage Acj9]